MGKSKIDYVDESWQVVYGCTKVSHGCENCYAEQMANRIAGAGNDLYKGVVKEGKWSNDVKRLPLGHKNWGRPRRIQKPSRIFVCSMSDLFHPDVPFWHIKFALKEVLLNTRHQFLFLTKRPERMLKFFDDCFDIVDGPPEVVHFMDVENPEHQEVFCLAKLWPLKNLWLGTTVENQKFVPRIETLSSIPAHNRWVSMEPLLSRISLEQRHVENIDRFEIGGESGPKARPTMLSWIYDLVQQIEKMNPFAEVRVKQLGSQWAKENGSKTYKGNDPSEWPVEYMRYGYPKDK